MESVVAALATGGLVAGAWLGVEQSPEPTPAAATQEAVGSAVSRPTPGPGQLPTAPVVTDATFTILAAGDVLPHTRVYQDAQLPDGTYDFLPLMDATREWSAGADLALCSLEVPLAPPGEPPTGYPTFGAPDALVTDLADLGWDGCTTATNHSMDRGLPGLRHTLDVMDAVGLGHVGTARSPAEAGRPQTYVLERGGRDVVVAHLAATTLDNGLPAPADAPWSVTTAAVGQVAELVDQAAAAREAGADLVVVSMHWGSEYIHAPDAEQRQIAEELAGSGEVDLLLGNHSHVPQPIERLPGGTGSPGMWVVYSMGNFISSQDRACCAMETATGTMAVATVRAAAEGGARVTDVEWSPVTGDRRGGHRIYPLNEVLAGPPPEALTLDGATLEQRAARVAEVMGTPARTEPPTPTGPEPMVVPRCRDCRADPGP